MSDSAILSNSRFQAGDRVVIRDDYPIGHIRTPVYIRGKSGVVTRCLGAFKRKSVV